MEHNKTDNPSGSVKVSANAIISIAEAAVNETEGVAVGSANGKIAVIAGAPISSKLIPPIKVTLGAESAVIDISVITDIGFKASEVARTVQEHVKAAVQNMTGIAVSKVNLKVVGVKGK